MKHNFADMTFEELVLKRDDLRKKRHDLMIKKSLGQLNNPLEIRIIRRQLARVLCRLYNFVDKEQQEQEKE